MLSLPGIYEDGKIKLSYRSDRPLPDHTEVLLIFVDLDSHPHTDSIDETETNGVDRNEHYYRSLREFERVKACGNITIIVDGIQHSYPLNDYSQGGLSFISDALFAVGQTVSAGIADPANPDLILMELEMEIRGVFEIEEFVDSENGRRYKVGCRFLDPIDEDLWHGLLQYLA